MQGMLSQVSLGQATITANGQPARLSGFPIRLPGAPEGDYTITFPLSVGRIRPARYYILPDDCLQELFINGVAVHAPEFPFCDYVRGRTLDLSPYLHAGVNNVRVTIHNGIGDLGLLMHPSFSDIVWLLPLLLLLVTFAATCFLAVVLLRTPTWIIASCVVLMLGITLRGYYLFTTPYWVRGHDTDAHIEYIRYIADHHTLPEPNKGWEFYQPPLYYALGGLWTDAGRATGFTEESIVQSIQWWSFALSIGSLLLMFRIGVRVFRRDQRNLIPILLSVPAFLPSLVFLSARINNDILVTFLEFLAVTLFIEWWHRPSRLVWIATALVTGLAILTKNNAIVLLPAFTVSLLLQPPLKGKGLWKKKAILAATACMTVLIIAGWFTVYRSFLGTSQNLIVGNTGNLNGGLRLQNNASYLLTFNPASVLEHPYNSPWSDEARRQYFWEYLYRAAFFGEFDFGPEHRTIASFVLFFSLPLCVVALYGLFCGFRYRFSAWLPMAQIGLWSLVGHLVFRFSFPFASSQDFRYSTILLAPFSYFLTIGIEGLRHPILARTALIALEATIILCVLLIT